MDVSLFDYHLPPNLIAQRPLRRRSDSRLLVLDRRAETMSHHGFSEVLKYLKRGDGLVINNTKVFRARMWAARKTGGKIEVFLLRRTGDTQAASDQWLALVSPSRRLHEGESLFFDTGHAVTLVKYCENGRWIVDFGSRRRCTESLSRFGHVPLPPYIHREDGSLDARRYQTVFADARHEGAVAAPTAGLHFSRVLIAQIRAKGVQVIDVTLHIGPGTFKPIKAERIEDHAVDPEFAELSARSARQINRIRERGGALFAVGTTSVRTLEAATIKDDQIEPFAGFVNLYIRPGFKFRAVDHLITNFHLPRSSLLVLVSAFAGREQALHAYREAVDHEYRFYSYGDAMLIL
jgi:S-adenosylmethionine:tRNA ribosyltransferase-isomerase